MAAVAGANGAICGWRGTYRWSKPDGWVAAGLDSTWAIATTAGSLVSHAIAIVRRRPGYDATLSERQNRHVYTRGFQPRRGFLITIGNVVSGAGDRSTASRRRVVVNHEAVHVWQARWFGPLFPVLYVSFLIVGGAYGAVMWATRRRRAPFVKLVDSYAYYANPFEWWAYSRDDKWPPRRMVPGCGWKRPMVRPFRRV